MHSNIQLPAWAAAKCGDRRRFRGDRKRIMRSDKGKKRKVPNILTCEDNALEELFMSEPCSAADSSSGSSSGSPRSSGDSSGSACSSDSSATDAAELKQILAKCIKKGQ